MFTRLLSVTFGSKTASQWIFIADFCSGSFFQPFSDFLGWLHTMRAYMNLYIYKIRSRRSWIHFQRRNLHWIESKVLHFYKRLPFNKIHFSIHCYSIEWCNYYEDKSLQKGKTVSSVFIVDREWRWCNLLCNGRKISRFFVFFHLLWTLT